MIAGPADKNLPAKHDGFKDCFSGTNSAGFITHKEGANHVFELEGEGKATPGFCPLYNMSLDELSFFKEWSLNN